MTAIGAIPQRRTADLALAALIGGAGAGLLDIVYACTVWALRGVPAERILQSVASGLLGRAAYDGGAAAAALGAALHFAMAIIIAAIFASASLLLPILRRRPIACGLLYGAGVFFVMNYVVVPLSAAHPGRPPRWPSATMELVAQMLLVGVPIALAARWKLGNRK
jgi:hypothetical protein